MMTTGAGLAIVVGLATPTVPAARAQNTWYVDDDNCDPGPGTGSPSDPFCTINDANIAAVYGDTISVRPGKYELAGFPRLLKLKDGVMLRSEQGVDETTILGEVRFTSGTGSDTLLEGFTITNTSGEGISCFGDPEIRGNKITECKENGVHIYANSDPRLVDCVISRNNQGGQFVTGAGVWVGNALSSPAPSYPIFDNCVIEDNVANFEGGGMNVTQPGVTSLVNCTIRGNSAGPGKRGGGIWYNTAPFLTATGSANAEQSSGVTNQLRLQNCLVTCNSAWRGGGAYTFGFTDSGELRLVNCTFTQNTAAGTGDGAAVAVDGPTLVVDNSILWGNTALDGSEDEIAIFAANSTVTVAYSDLAGGCTGNCLGGTVLDVNPLFVDPLGPDGVPCTDDEDFRTRGCSPVHDAGDNTRVLEDVADLDGDGDFDEATPYDRDGSGSLRFRDDLCVVDTGVSGNGYTEIVDMGAYEDQCGAPLPNPEPERLALPGDPISAKNRYLSIKAGAPGRSQAIRVKPIQLPPPFDVWDCTSGNCVNGNGGWWAGEPFKVCEKASESSGPPCSAVPGQLKGRRYNWFAPLVCDPQSAHFMDWHGQCIDNTCVGGLEPGKSCALDEDCQEVVSLEHEGVVPSLASAPARYDIQVVDAACDLEDEASYSAPLTLQQSLLGDIVGLGSSCPIPPPPQGQAGQEDVNAIVAKFSNLQCQVKKARCDLTRVGGGAPDHKCDSLDINAVLEGFANPSTLPWGPVNPSDPCDQFGAATAASE